MSRETLRTPWLAQCRFLCAQMIGAYLLINILLFVMSPFTAGWPIWATTAVAVPPMVLGMVYLVTPLARRSGA